MDFRLFIRLCVTLVLPPWILKLGAQVSIHVAASHKASQHQTLISQIQIVGPMVIFTPNSDQFRGI